MNLVSTTWSNNLEAPTTHTPVMWYVRKPCMLNFWFETCHCVHLFVRTVHTTWRVYQNYDHYYYHYYVIISVIVTSCFIFYKGDLLGSLFVHLQRGLASLAQTGLGIPSLRSVLETKSTYNWLQVLVDLTSEIPLIRHHHQCLLSEWP